jgi:demethylmenaquinone methyltransferase/2-methoxy-6-polyprenyl-1,4-benzoquinol methylase
MALNKKSYTWFYDNIQSHYYNLAMKWCFLPLGGERRCRQKLIEPISFEPEDKILDMCCGAGGATFAIARKAGAQTRITGMDLSWGQLKNAGRRLKKLATRKSRLNNLGFLEGDVTKTCFKDGYFDKVFITHALHEMEREERLDVLREAKRILRAGGKVFILEVNDPKNRFVRLFIGFWFFYWLPFNFETPTRRDMLKHGLENEMKEVGFENIKKTSSHRNILQVTEGQK